VFGQTMFYNGLYIIYFSFMLFGIYGNYGSGNIGDELVGQGILHIINTSTKQDTNSKTVIFAHDITLARKSWKNILVVNILPAGFRSLFSEWITSFLMLRTCHVVIFGGGTLFTDFPKQAFHLWMWHIKLLLFFNKNVIIIGQGFGPFFDADHKNKLAEQLKKIKYITVRDPESQHMFTENNPSPYFLRASDPIFALPYKKPISLDDGKFYIVVSLRPWKGINEIAQKTVDVIHQLHDIYKDKLEVIALPLQDSHEDDYSIFAEMKKHLHENIQMQIIPRKNWNAEVVLETIRRADFILGMRLHANLLAINYRKPFLAIDYAGKTFENLHFLEMKDAAISVADYLSIETKEIIQKIQDNLKMKGGYMLHKAYFRGKIFTFPHSIALDKVIQDVEKQQKEKIENFVDKKSFRPLSKISGIFSKK
jgi:polysaccharide pyruvyl transferase WcaK-like protein